MDKDENIKFQVIPYKILSSENHWQVVTADLYPAVLDFIENHFMPDEPVLRSLKIKRTWLMDKLLWEEFLKNGSSVCALGPEGQLLGIMWGRPLFHSLVRVGRVVKQTDWLDRKTDDALKNHWWIIGRLVRFRQFLEMKIYIDFYNLIGTIPPRIFIFFCQLSWCSKFSKAGTFGACWTNTSVRRSTKAWSSVLTGIVELKVWFHFI